ncbi:MAG: flagellar biosynthetic protein FliO [Armatimonadetes bacterium]|nr:flagellar biosynthetic protein FliO [Armatimonadota bacterium]
MTELSSYFAQMLVLLVLLGALAGAAVWAARRWLPSGAMGQGSLRIVASLPIGVGARLVIVELEDRRVLLGVTAHQISFLCELPQRAPEEAHD